MKLPDLLGHDFVVRNRWGERFSAGGSRPCRHPCGPLISNHAARQLVVTVRKCVQTASCKVSMGPVHPAPQGIEQQFARAFGQCAGLSCSCQALISRLVSRKLHWPVPARALAETVGDEPARYTLSAAVLWPRFSEWPATAPSEAIKQIDYSCSGEKPLPGGGPSPVLLLSATASAAPCRPESGTPGSMTLGHVGPGSGAQLKHKPFCTISVRLGCAGHHAGRAVGRLETSQGSAKVPESSSAWGLLFVLEPRATVMWSSDVSPG